MLLYYVLRHVSAQVQAMLSEEFFIIIIIIIIVFQGLGLLACSGPEFIF
jgi:hypothetical protein